MFFLPPGRGRSAGRRRAIDMRCALRTATPSTLVLPALQEQQLQATSAQTCKTCVCDAAVCFLVLLLPRSCSRLCNKPLKKNKMRRSGSPQTPSAISTHLTDNPVLLLCLGGHPAPRTRHCATKRVRLQGPSPRPLPAGVVLSSETHLTMSDRKVRGK